MRRFAPVLILFGGIALYAEGNDLANAQQPPMKCAAASCEAS